jgi:hypothetical protein
MPHDTLSMSCDIVLEAIDAVSRKHGLGIV